MSETVFQISRGYGNRIPIVISVPHCGTEFPAELRSSIRKEQLAHPEDTDWLVDQLYDFAPHIGVTLIQARYSRYVVDLNRAPDSGKLYADGRPETPLVPNKTFAGKPIWRDANATIDLADRMRKYYTPYHNAVRELLDELQTEYKHVLLLDAHSIARSVPAIRQKPFADLMPGNDNGRTMATSLWDEALGVLNDGPYTVSPNEPFRGGYITRTFGEPARGRHAMQLEMSNDVYLDTHQNRPALDEAKNARLRPTLERLLLHLAECLRGLGQ